MPPSWLQPSDLAPGDLRSAGFDWEGIELHRIRSANDPLFETAFAALWQEFGARHELEQREVLAHRLQRNPRELVHGAALLYELLLLTKHGELVAVRDHTAIVHAAFEMAVVHMSHNLVAIPFRRSGIAGWLRALPIATARTCLAAQGFDRPVPIYLVGEMEPADPSSEACVVRLTAYEKAGYSKIDPAAVHYLQPDFRTPAEIDATGGPRPLPLCLLVRKVGREHETLIRAKTVHRIVSCLYRMYEAEFRPQDMQCVWKNLEHFPCDDQHIPLLAPTAS